MNIGVNQFCFPMSYDVADAVKAAKRLGFDSIEVCFTAAAFILIASILGSARIVLGHHTLGEVLSGFAVGLICALLVLHPVSNILFRVFLF